MFVGKGIGGWLAKDTIEYFLDTTINRNIKKVEWANSKFEDFWFIEEGKGIFYYESAKQAVEPAVNSHQKKRSE